MEDKKLTWQEMWLKNYRGEGDCKELEKRTKDLDYGSKKGGTYLPWAIVDRIFKFQDGKTEVIRTRQFIPQIKQKHLEGGIVESEVIFLENFESIVEVDRFYVKDEVDEETGVITPRYNLSFFVNLKATWQGQEYIERYPLLDSNSKPLSRWTQVDLNKAVQRAKVKAIAIVSGIGYKLFEDGDLQFEDDGDGKSKPEPEKETAKEKADRLKKEVTQREIKKETRR